MTNKNQVTITPNCFYGCIDDSTPCGKAKAEQVKADLEVFAILLQSPHFSTRTKETIYNYYVNKICEYVEREEPPCCDCDCEEEEEEELTIEDLQGYRIIVNGKGFYCNSYNETIDLMKKLYDLGFDDLEVLGYPAGEGEVHLTIIRDIYNGCSLEIE